MAISRHSLFAAIAVLTVSFGQAQNRPARTPELPTSQYATAYPQRPPGDPAQVARGQEVFEVNCGFCHGSDARGGDGGPNLIRAQIVMNDNKGENIAPVLREGRPAQGMPKFDLSDAQIADIAAFVH